MKHFELRIVLGATIPWRRSVWMGGNWLIYQEEEWKAIRLNWRLRLGSVRTALPDEDPMTLPSMGTETTPMLIAEHTVIGNLLFPKIIARLDIGDGGHIVAIQWQYIAKQLGWRPGSTAHLPVTFDKAQRLLKQWEAKREV